MRKTVVATLIAVAFGLTGVTFAQAAPAGGNGVALGKAASGLAPTEQAQWRRRRRRRRSCFHRRRSRTVCAW
jgi:hypothetical protein